MGKEYQEDDVSTSCISSEPTMQGEVSSSTLAPLHPKESNEKFHLDETEAHQRSLKASLVKVSAMLLFMISSFVAIFAPGSPEAPLHSADLGMILNDLRTRVRIPGIVYIVLNDLRARVRTAGTVYTVLQSVDKIHYALGSAAILVIGTVIYFSSRKKQSRGVICSVEENVIEEAPAEIQCENDDAVKPSVCPCSNSPEASLHCWEPISELKVKLELEYSVGDMSSSEKMSPTDTTQVFERKTRRKSMSTITHNVVKRDSSVGSSSSCDRSRSRECKVEAPLRRSSRIRNKVMSPPSAGALQITSRG
ncbi:hypothetical protein SUGI_0499720 [Cryptomeria japonica]|uniref:uncharacterized protein LOC131034143 n=1 Tax=Cryptomeria japonica TaxID=3369 RepID=UPI002408CE5D|nr:uncharacterized protein LOC131034143 [Cryptomeria japonica]GLJ26046.1 hypothetical protein SUGI_0499720 [Cryptomeria japonica]